MTLFRYILREFVAPFVFSLSLIIFLFVLNLVFQMLGKIAGKGLSWGTVAEFFLLNLAWMVALAVPMAVLVATVTAYSRLTSDGETTALKSSGVGPLRMLAPALMMGIVAAVSLVVFNDRYLPEMNRRSRELQADIRRKKPTMVLEPGVFLSDIPGHVVIARDVQQQDNSLGDVVVYQENDIEYSTVISARAGKLVYEEASEGFVFSLDSGQIERTSKKKALEYQQTNFNKAIFRIAAPEMSLRRTATNWKGDRELSVGELMDRIRDYASRDSVNMSKEIGKLKVELHKKFSVPAACIIFALLGCFLGQWVRKSGIGVSAGYSIFFFLVYWVFLIGGEDLADRGRLSPAVAMWAPNVFFASLALFLLWMERSGRRFDSLIPRRLKAR